ncbi:DoxX family protein [Streptomyces katrae]|uniref:DoxX family protein n=1 Tax=Streptomyces katrae TaxID=68223 RepID=A0ABT7H0I0_9ACTN|nr:DoxX family protein [Streptomyces katrae]MDK9499353.1 DoxX family protein [Streptomyces katrae]
MSTTATVFTIIAAVLAVYSAVSLYTRSKYTVEPLVQYGVPEKTWNLLATAKLAGGLGLLAGFVVPAIGIAAGIGLVLYFIGAVVVTLRARDYAHVVFPVIYSAPMAVALALTV